MNAEAIESLDSESLRTIEYILSEIPENDLMRQCINRSQLEYFFFLRRFFNQVSQGISNYFLGKPLFENTDIALREKLDIELQKWICFYGLLQWGWDYILSEAPKKGWKISGNPGDALRFVLTNYAECMFVQHQAVHLEFSPRRGYEQTRLIPRIEGILNRLENNGDVTEEDIKLINNFTKNSQKGEPVKPELNDFFHFCMQVFEKHKNKPKIKHKYKDYLRIQSEYEVLAMREWQPRKKSQGFQVVNQNIHNPP
jgi:hypothetical protein